MMRQQQETTLDGSWLLRSQPQRRVMSTHVRNRGNRP